MRRERDTYGETERGRGRDRERGRDKERGEEREREIEGQREGNRERERDGDDKFRNIKKEIDRKEENK